MERQIPSASHSLRTRAHFGLEELFSRGSLAQFVAGDDDAGAEYRHLPHLAGRLLEKWSPDPAKEIDAMIASFYDSR